MPTSEEVKNVIEALRLKEQKATNKLLTDLVEALKSKEMPSPAPFPDQMKVSLEGVEVATLKGDKGEPGDKPTSEELLALITPLIPKPKPGQDGYTPKKGVDYFDGENGYTPQKGVDYFDGTPGKNADPVDIEAIVEQVLEKIPATKTEGGIVQRIFGGKTRVSIHDLSDLCDGVLKTFPVPRNFGIIGVFSTQAPLIYRPGIDYTVGNRTITLTDEVGAPQAGQTLTVQYIV